MTPGTRLPPCKSHFCFTTRRALDISEAETARAHLHTLLLDTWRKCHQDREISKTEGAVPLPSLWQESNIALLTCRGPLRNSGSKRGLRKRTHHNRYYMGYKSLPSLFKANTTAAELVSCSKWRWEPGHKLNEQQHWRAPAALQTGTASGQGSAIQGCRGNRGQFSPHQHTRNTVFFGALNHSNSLFFCAQPWRNKT